MSQERMSLALHLCYTQEKGRLPPFLYQCVAEPCLPPLTHTTSLNPCHHNPEQ